MKGDITGDWVDFRIGMACGAALAVAAMALILILFIAAAHAEEPIHHPQTPTHFMPEFYMLVEEAPAINSSTVTGKFRTFAGCRMAEVLANKQQGIAAFCAPPQWLSKLPPQMQPSISPDLIKAEPGG